MLQLPRSTKAQQSPGDSKKSNLEVKMTPSTNYSPSPDFNHKISLLLLLSCWFSGTTLRTLEQTILHNICHHRGTLQPANLQAIYCSDSSPGQPLLKLYTESICSKPALMLSVQTVTSNPVPKQWYFGCSYFCTNLVKKRGIPKLQNNNKKNLPVPRLLLPLAKIPFCPLRCQLMLMAKYSPGITHSLSS